MGAVVHSEDAVLGRRAERDILAAKGLAEAPSSVLEVDEAVAADLADLVTRRVLDRRQDLGKGARARSISLSRRRHAESIMRAQVVIARAPFVESTLAIGEIAEALSVDHLRLEGAVETLLFALGLRMTRATDAARSPASSANPGQRGAFPPHPQGGGDQRKELPR